MSTFGTARLENGPDPVRGRAQLFASGGEQVAVHASLDTLMMLGRCPMALFQCASSFVTGPARRRATDKLQTLSRNPDNLQTPK